MLQITHAAAELLTEIRREQDVPEDHGLRVFAERSTADEVSIGIGFTALQAKAGKLEDVAPLQECQVKSEADAGADAGDAGDAVGDASTD